ncbi:MAG: hypothetical protein AAB443_00640 [Patescibacteria group bacterium]
MTLLPAETFNIGIIALILISLVAFYVVKSFIKSVVASILYTFLIGILLFFAGLVYFFGVLGTVNLFKGLLRL